MSKFDDIAAQSKAHPEWGEASKAMDAKIRRAQLQDTTEGSILDSLEGRGLREGQKASLESKTFGTHIFTYGQESALMQMHIEDGVAVPYTPLLDLRKQWWKESFLLQERGNRLEGIGLIAPSLIEALSVFLGSEAVSQLSLTTLISGAKGDEYVENDMYGTLVENKFRRAMDVFKMQLNVLVGPNFSIEFGNGNGDILRKLRLMPKTVEGQKALMGVGNDSLVRDSLQKVIDARSTLATELAKIGNETSVHKDAAQS